MKRVTVRAMVGSLFLAIFQILIGSLSAHAQSTPEFESGFYDATQCIQHEEAQQDSVKVILAKNFCPTQVAALICFRIINAEGLYNERGWYCDYSTLYDPNLLRTVSRGGFYHPRRRAAACSISNTRCNQVLKSVEFRVNSNHGSPELAAVAIRKQLGLGG